MPIKPNMLSTKLFGSRERLNDIGMRTVLVPLFGIAIPIVTQMVPHERFSNWEVKLSYIYTILMALIIYEGSRFLLFTLRTYFDWLNKPLKKIIAIVVVVPFYCVPVSVLMMVGWYNFFLDGKVDWAVIKLATIIILGCVFFVVNIYETIFLVKDAASDKVKKEQLERAKVEAELEALKNQIDPHFIFNSLNTLSHLIEERPDKAQLFNDNLADVYRYILHNKGRDLVLLKEEIHFINDYFSLLKIRFEDAVQMNIEINEEQMETLLVPPISLQILIENAIKHNEFSDAQPIIITIKLEDGKLVVHNEIRKKQLRKPSSKIGLENLKERYRLITNKEVVIDADENNFTVYLPVLAV
jgi:sensor histidine kinase YesM